MNTDNHLASLLLRWQEQQFHGQEVSAAELCRDCPDLEPQLSEQIQILRHMNALLGASGMVATLPARHTREPTPGIIARPLPAEQPVDQTLSANGKPTATAEPALASIQVPGYEMVRELGRGGMGVVFLARQSSLGRLVALKMILAGKLAGSEELRHFRTEPALVARLSHPNIVQVFEVGEHEGRPFFSMEFCPGGSLDKKLAGSPLPPEEAVRLVETLACAMQAAHQAKVIHRDLKPANVVLAADGTPKITDFGLAKQLNQASVTGAVVGTPSYMAPEHAAGSQALRPAADIYALGAILYECLTGRPPFKAATLYDTMLQVINQEPVPPRQLNAKVPVDLETICLKCLEKEPGKRYASAAALADDLARFRAGKPVAARPVGALSRGWRWCRRNPVVAGLSAALLLALLGGLAGMTLLWFQAEQQRGEAVEAREQAQRLAVEAQHQEQVAEEQTRLAREEADRARREARKANRTAQVLTEMFEGADPVGLNGIPVLKVRMTETLTARQLLDRSVDKILHDLNEEPEAQAKLLDTLGNVYCSLGVADRARVLLEKALALRRQVLPPDHPDLAATLNNLGWLNHEAGDYATAERLYREALAIRQRHAQEDPLALSATMFTLGWLLSDMQEFAAAEELMKEALDLRLRTLGPDHRDVAVVRLGLTAVYIEQGKIAEAVTPYRQAVATLRQVDGAQGLAEAIDLFQRGLMARELPAIRGLLGLKTDQAIEDCLERALNLAKQTLGDQHYFVAMALHELAVTLLLHNKDEQAERYFRDCLALVRRNTSLAHPKARLLLANFCYLLKRRGKLAEAEQLVQEALQVRREHYPEGYAGIADILVIQAELCDDSGPSSRFQQSLREALALYCRNPSAPRGFSTQCVQLLANDLDAAQLADVACQLARTAAGRAEQSGERARFLDLAMLALSRARAKGFKDVSRLKHDHDVDVLRQREDFQQLLAALQASSGG